MPNPSRHLLLPLLTLCSLALLGTWAQAGNGTSSGAKGLTRASQEGGPEYAVRAVVVGISDFKALGPEDDLAFGDTDAKWMASLLPRAVKVNHLELLTGADATQGRIETALREALGGAREDEIVLLYFLTHGAVLGREGFLLAQDSIPEGRLPATGISFKSLAELVSASKARQVLSFADIVHQPLKGVSGPKTGPGAKVDALFGQNISRRDRSFVLTSTRGNESSGLGGQACDGHGAFSCAIAGALSGAADTNRDGLVALGELALTLPQVTSYATGAAQSPSATGIFDSELAFTANSSLADTVKMQDWSAKVQDRLELCFESNGQPVDAGHVFKTGDTLSMTVSAPLSGHLYAINIGPDLKTNPVFPMPQESSAVSQGATVRIPADVTDPLRFTDPTGTEHITLIWTRDPLSGPAEVDNLIRSMGVSTVASNRAGEKSLMRVSQSDDVGSQRCTEYSVKSQGDTLIVQVNLMHK